MSETSVEDIKLLREFNPENDYIKLAEIAHELILEKELSKYGLSMQWTTFKRSQRRQKRDWRK